MRKGIAWSMMSLVAAFVFSASLMAQEKTEVSIQVKKDGKVLRDTTYQFDDADEAEHVLKMVEVMSGLDADMDQGHYTYNYTMSHSDGEHGNAMVFISKDGEKTEIKEIHGDSLVWISEGGEPDMEHLHGENVMILKQGDGETFDILVEKEGDEPGKKRVKVVVSGDEKGNWTAVTADEKDLDENEKVYYISEDDNVKVKVRKIIEEDEEGENVKVIVIEKEINTEDKTDKDKEE
jgi:hypothetical protein